MGFMESGGMDRLIELAEKYEERLWDLADDDPSPKMSDLEKEVFMRILEDIETAVFFVDARIDEISEKLDRLIQNGDDEK